MNNKFNIGDKVKVRRDLCRQHGSHGWYPNSEMISLKGEEFEIVGKIGREAYELNVPQIGKLKDTGWTDEMLEQSDKSRVPSKPINIRVLFNGRTTMATIKDKTGVAICHPEDGYNVNEGIRIAVERVLGIEPRTEVKVIDNTKKLEDYTLEELLKEVSKRVK